MSGVLFGVNCLTGSSTGTVVLADDALSAAAHPSAVSPDVLNVSAYGRGDNDAIRLKTNRYEGQVPGLESGGWERSLRMSDHSVRTVSPMAASRLLFIFSSVAEIRSSTC